MIPNSLPGSLRRQFVAFASTFQDLSPEGRRSLMVASVISTLSLGMIGAASVYTWHSGEPRQEASIQPPPIAAQHTRVSSVHGLSAESLPPDNTVAAEERVAAPVSALPVAAFQPADTPSAAPALVIATVAPSASPIPQTQPQTAPPAPPLRHARGRGVRRHVQAENNQQQLSDAFIRSYLARHFNHRSSAIAVERPAGRTPGTHTWAQRSSTPSRLSAIPASTDIVRRHQVSAAAAVAHPQTSGRYAIQVGYYTNRAYARLYASQLAQQGLHAYLISTKTRGPVRVFVGRFDSVTDAQTAFRRLPAKVSDGMIVKTDW